MSDSANAQVSVGVSVWSVLGCMCLLGHTGCVRSPTSELRAIINEVTTQGASVRIVDPKTGAELRLGTTEGARDRALAEALLVQALVNDITDAQRLEGQALTMDHLLVILEGCERSAIVHFNGLGFTLGRRPTWVFHNGLLAECLRGILEINGWMRGFRGRWFNALLAEAAGQVKADDNIIEPTDEEMREHEIREWSRRRVSYEMQPGEADALARVSKLSPTGGVLNRRVNGDEQTELHVAAGLRYWAVVRWLLLHGADPNLRDCAGRRPLHVAAEMGDADVVSLMVIAGAAVDARDVAGRTAVHSAFAFEPYPPASLDAISVLIEAGAPVNAADDEGRTPLILAAIHDRADVASLLLAAGADRKRTDKQGRSAADIAKARRLTRFLDTMRKVAERQSAQKPGK